jgi:hypothetical protein
MMRMEEPENRTERPAGAGSLTDVLASIRALVSAETSARLAGPDGVLMLTPDMRVDHEDGEAGEAPPGEVLAAGIGADAAPRDGGAPILDEEALRALVNRIVREELQGELGDRITRNLRKLIRREIGQMAAERRHPPSEAGSG